MFDFLDSSFKRRAFKKALKEVKEEGYYVNLKEGELSKTPIDLSSEVADLSNKTIANKLFPKEETYDVTGLTPNLDTEYEEPKIEEIIGEDLQETKPEEYFAQTTFVDGETKEDEDLLSRQTSEKRYFEKTEDQIEYDKEQFKRTFIANLHIDDKEQPSQEQKQVEQPVAQEEPIVEETQDKAPLPEKQPVPEIVVVAAPVQEPVPEAQKVVKEEEPKPQKRKYTKRKRRKYDADIVGGFNY